MPEKIKFNVSVPGGQGNNPVKNPYTLKEAIQLIKLKNYPKETEDALIKLISKQPSNTYEHFLKNIYTHLNNIQTKNNNKKKG